MFFSRSVTFASRASSAVGSLAVETSWTLPSTSTTKLAGPVMLSCLSSVVTPLPNATVPRPTPSLSRIGSSFLAPVPDAVPIAIDARPPLHARGDACTAMSPCDAALACLALPGGYCASDCAACDGTCVETGRLGPTCMASCTSDADCRRDEGYVCD